MTVDAVVLQIVRGALTATLKEMELVIERTAMSPVIREKADHFVGIYDRQGRIVDAHIGMSGARMVDPVLEHFPVETMEPGDVYWYNDPHRSRGAIQHNGDMCFVSPIFIDGELTAFGIAFGHFWDIGGTVPGSLSPHATEIFHEGTLVPPIRIIHAGTLNRDAYAVILNNSRYPEALEGDTRALMAACRLADARVSELAARYGRATIASAFDEIVNRSVEAYRAYARELIAEGEYHFFDYLDQDPVGGESRRIDVRITRRGDKIVADLTGSGPQARGPVNFIATPGAVGLMAGRLFCYLNPELSLNEGALHIFDEVLTKPGTITQPNFPAATGLRSHTAIRLIGCVLGALGQATGGNSPAGTPVYVIYMLRTASEYFSEGVGSGQGARPTADGINAIYQRDQKNYPIEYEEREFPMLVENYSIRQDSSGPGYNRGGAGVVREVRVLTDCIMATRMDNARFPPFGANQGAAGAPGRIIVNPGTAEETEINPVDEGISLKAGDLLRVETCGGGGWGDPFTREPERVRRDVLEGYVSVAGAETDYGVVLDRESLQIDQAATDKLRSAFRPERPFFDRGAAARERLVAMGVSE
ncbi:MAG: hydantoinase B/oxoprolinase family protein [Dehalococcoidia bacterium]